MKKENMRTIQSAENVFGILESLQRREGARLSEVAADVSLSPSTVHQYLKTLEADEFVVQDGDEYDVGLRFLELGEYARNRKPVSRLAREKVASLAEATGERAQFAMEEHGRCVVLYTVTGEQAVETNIHTGKRVYLHATAAGKAILAHMSQSRVDDVIERHGLPAVTPNTITDREELLEECERIRETGVSMNRQEDTHGLWAIGVPVTGPDEVVLGALSISGPTHRLKIDGVRSEISDLLLGSANELELNLAYM